jgi:hypothetical protein
MNAVTAEFGERPVTGHQVSPPPGLMIATELLDEPAPRDEDAWLLAPAHKARAKIDTSAAVHRLRALRCVAQRPERECIGILSIRAQWRVVTGTPEP